MHELREQGSVVVHCPAECNGMFEGNLYGSNPYWMHSSICPAAIHAGVINRDGGKVLMEWAGEVSSFPRSISNGVMSWQRITPGRAFSLKRWALPAPPTTSPSATGPSCVLEMEVAYSADTFKKIKVAGSSECCLKCDADIECMAWTYNPGSGVCGFKRHIGTRVLDKKSVSGLPISVQSPSHPLQRSTKYSPLTRPDGSVWRKAGEKFRSLGGRDGPFWHSRPQQPAWAKKQRAYAANRRWARPQRARGVMNSAYPMRPPAEEAVKPQLWGHRKRRQRRLTPMEENRRFMEHGQQHPMQRPMQRPIRRRKFVQVHYQRNWHPLHPGIGTHPLR